jgi:predicted outer membrane protein
MKNVIVFINVCILGLITLLSLDANRDPTSSLPEASRNKQVTTVKDKAGSTTTTVLASVPGKSDRATTRVTRRTLSENEKEAVTDFIRTMSQERMLDLAQSSIAVQRGTVRSLKEYGSWMVIHQQRMLDDLAALARRYGIATTSTLNASRISDLSEIQKLHGKKFDALYVKVMTAALKSDLKQLERASYSPNPDVQVFATRYTALTKDNLTKIQQIRRTYRWTR